MARTADAVGRVARRRYWREADARVVVEAWRRSGERLVRFAARHGVKPKRLSRWATRLRGVVSESEPLVLHPVRLVQGRAAADDGAGGGTIEIEFSAGACVRVPTGFAAEDLRRVLSVLRESASC